MIEMVMVKGGYKIVNAVSLNRVVYRTLRSAFFKAFERLVRGEQLRT